MIRADRGAREQGSSPITAVFGVFIFLAFLLLAAQVTIHLYATSVVTAVAFDEARRASTYPPSCDGVQAQVRNRLGSYGSTVDTVECTMPAVLGSGSDPAQAAYCAGDFDSLQLEVRIAGPSPSRGLTIMAGPSAVDRIDRSASSTVAVSPDGGVVC
ncbi:MAG: hypothetical protein JJT89_02085 [Nitriliruptoraceae bacterium]|nr:hypothetical protein [Nitriliruptoraceae bacterium]